MVVSLGLEPEVVVGLGLGLDVSLEVVLGTVGVVVDPFELIQPAAMTAPSIRNMSKTAVFFIAITWIICPLVVGLEVYKFVGYFGHL